MAWRLNFATAYDHSIALDAGISPLPFQVIAGDLKPLKLVAMSEGYPLPTLSNLTSISSERTVCDW
jgi:hypothetical protein